MRRDDAASPSEEKIAHAMVRARLINENQLKTALDYQRSLGGNLVDVIGRLGFVHTTVLSRFLSDLGISAAPSSPAEAAGRGPRDVGLVKNTKDRRSRPAPPAPPPPEIDEDDLPTQSSPPTSAEAAASETPGPPAAHETPDATEALLALIRLLAHKGIVEPDEEEDLKRLALAAQRGS